MTIPLEIKGPVLRDFYKKLQDPTWTFDGSGPKEKDGFMLKEFNVVCKALMHFSQVYLPSFVAIYL